MKTCFFLTALAAISACSDPAPRELTDLETLVEQYESLEISRQDYLAQLALVPDDESIGQSLSGTWQESRLLHARAQPYLVENGFTIAKDAILVIEEGAQLQIDNEAVIEIKGRIYAVGTDATTIRISAAQGEHYTDLFLRSGPNQLVSVDLSRAERAVHVTHKGTTHTRIESSVFNRWRDLAIAQTDSSGLHVLTSRFGYETPEGEVSGETIRTRNSGRIVIEDCQFDYRTGYHDVLDLQDCDPAPEQWPIVIGNVFDGGEDDAVDLDNCSAIVVGNHIRNFRPININQQFAGVNGGGVTGDGPGSTPFIANNIIDGCFHAVGFKNGARPAIVHNTIINSNIGITLYQSVVGNPMPEGRAYNNILYNNVGWLDGANNDVVLNGKWWAGYNQVDQVQGTLDAQHNIFATESTVYPGTGNMNDDPLLDQSSGLPLLKVGSPAIDAGLSEFDLPDIDMQLALDYMQSDFLEASRQRNGMTLVSPDLGAVER